MLKVLSKIGRIFLGWYYWVTNRNNELAKGRLAHCLYCPFRKGITCGECGCVLQAKARLPEESCPKFFWGPNFINGGFVKGSK